MTRQTSVDAYNKLKASGDLSLRRWQVYEVVYQYGPMTSAMAHQQLVHESRVGKIAQTRARFTELLDMGVLQEMGTTICPITGHRVILWDCTSADTVKPLPRKQSSREIIKQQALRIQRLEHECLLLRTELDRQMPLDF